MRTLHADVLQGAREKRSLSALDDFNFTYYDDYDYEDAMQANVNEGEWHAPREQIEQREETFKRLYMKEKRYSAVFVLQMIM